MSPWAIPSKNDSSTTRICSAGRPSSAARTRPSRSRASNGVGRIGFDRKHQLIDLMKLGALILRKRSMRRFQAMVKTQADTVALPGS